jgi:hypothetical protein
MNNPFDHSNSNHEKDFTNEISVQVDPDFWLSPSSPNSNFRKKPSSPKPRQVSVKQHCISINPDTVFTNINKEKATSHHSNVRVKRVHRVSSQRKSYNVFDNPSVSPLLQHTNCLKNSRMNSASNSKYKSNALKSPVEYVIMINNCIDLSSKIKYKPPAVRIRRTSDYVKFTHSPVKTGKTSEISKINAKLKQIISPSQLIISLSKKF